MTSKVEILRDDVAELYRLAELTERRRIKDILSVQAKKIETEISLLQEKENLVQPNSTILATAKRAYEVKITSYGWDQNKTTVKIFVSLPKVQTLPPDNIVCGFTESSFNLSIKELEGKNYTLSVKNLFQGIKPGHSSWKTKSDTVLLLLTKKSEGNWSSLTKTAKDPITAKPPKMDEEGDPSAGVMNLLKQMYDDGDDEMKRTIAKAWTESRDKTGMNLGL